MRAKGRILIRTSRKIVRRLDRMNTNCAVEKGSSQHIRFARAPIHLESPVVCQRKLRSPRSVSKTWIHVYKPTYFSNNFGSLRIPAESTEGRECFKVIQKMPWHLLLPGRNQHWESACPRYSHHIATPCRSTVSDINCRHGVALTAFISIFQPRKDEVMGLTGSSGLVGRMYDIRSQIC
jgi:hypothetical protein